jgi:hypothetical protein
VFPEFPRETVVPGFAQDPLGAELLVGAGLGVPEPPLDRPVVEPDASVLDPLPVPPLSLDALQPTIRQTPAAAIRAFAFMFVVPWCHGFSN